jgi:hypothetical protein
VKPLLLAPIPVVGAALSWETVPVEWRPHLIGVGLAFLAWAGRITWKVGKALERKLDRVLVRLDDPTEETEGITPLTQQVRDIKTTLDEHIELDLQTLDRVERLATKFLPEESDDAGA